MAYIKFVAQNSELGERSKSTAVLSGVASPSERKAKGRAAEVVEIGREYPDKDVAVLKVQASNLYTVPLGDDATAASGTKVFAIGYPGLVRLRASRSPPPPNVQPPPPPPPSAPPPPIPPPPPSGGFAPPPGR